MPGHTDIDYHIDMFPKLDNINTDREDGIILKVPTSWEAGIHLDRSFFCVNCNGVRVARLLVDHSNGFKKAFEIHEGHKQARCLTQEEIDMTDWTGVDPEIFHLYPEAKRQHNGLMHVLPADRKNAVVIDLYYLDTTTYKEAGHV